MCPYKDPVKRREYNRQYQLAYYRKNRPAMIKRTNDRKKELREWVIELKRELICSVCGTSGKDNPWAMEFHHNDDYEKKDTVSFLVSGGYGRRRIMKEISKCFPVCSNCHRKIHYEESKRKGAIRGAGLGKGEGNNGPGQLAKRKKNARYRKKRLE